MYTTTITRENTMATTTMQDHWSDVENTLSYAHLIAFDGCHKIYVALDEHEAKWFKDNYNGTSCDDRTFEGTEHAMLEKLREWWDESCGLRFISGVSHNEEDPNYGFVTLIPQGASDEVDDDDEEDY
jgi:hypothetical protein